MQPISGIGTCKKMCMLESMKYSTYVMTDYNGMMMVYTDMQSLLFLEKHLKVQIN